MTKDKIYQLNKLLQVPIKRRLDANCIVFINTWIEEEKKEYKNKLLEELRDYFQCDCRLGVIYLESLNTWIDDKLKNEDIKR